MKSEILYPGAFPMARVELASGETIKAESGAMVASSATIDVESKMEGGFLGALSRKFLTGEKFFFQTLRASRGAGEVLLAPTVPGEIVMLELDGVNEYMVQKDGFLAGAETIKLDSQMQSLSRGLLGGEGFFILKVSGKGMAEVEADASKAYEDNYRIGGGGTVGLLADITDRWKLLATGTYLRFALGDKSEDIRWSIGQRYTLTTNLAFRVEYNHRSHDNDVLATLQMYF